VLFDSVYRVAEVRPTYGAGLLMVLAVLRVYTILRGDAKNVSTTPP